MTFSILAFDEETGTYGGAAATGSLCVGGWVLRGGAESGMSASQGTAPSTLWGEGVLARMTAGQSAKEAVQDVTAADPGRDHRQLAALDPKGGVGHFTGAASIPAAGAVTGGPAVASGNMLSGEAVLAALLQGYQEAGGAMPERLLAALRRAEAAGGDSRGLLSAAMLVVSRDAPPLTLRIDRSDAPIPALAQLLDAARSDPYAGWLDVVPTLDDPFRSPDPGQSRR